MTINGTTTINMKINVISSLPGGGDEKDDDNNYEGSSSLTIAMVIIFINHYTKKLYHYNNLSLPTFFWKKIHVLSVCSGITTILKV